MERGTGQTTKQMKEAPKDAIFIWCNNVLSYPRHLARDLGRSDLHIFAPDELERDRIRGGDNPIIVDHAAELTPRQRDMLAAYRSRGR